MVLNVYTIVNIFVSLLLGGISLYLTVESVRFALRRSSGPEVQQRFYLTFHLAQVFLLIEALNWPLFYITLQSLVPYIEGAMCIYGVTQARQPLSTVIQLYRPLVFFLVIGWFLLHRLDTKTESGPLARRKTILLMVVGPLVLIDSVLMLYYITGFRVEVDVACCTTVFDLQVRKTESLSKAILGEGYRRVLPYIYLVSNGFFCLLLWVCYKKAYQRSIPFWLSATTVFAIFNAGVTITGYFEFISPRVVGIEDHHCIYCMWKYSPLSALSTAFFVSSTLMPGWALLLRVLGNKEETSSLLPGMTRRLSFGGIILLVLSLLLQILVT